MDRWLGNVNVIRVVSLLIGILLWVIVHLDERAGKDPILLKDAVEEHLISNVNITAMHLDTQNLHLLSMEPKTINILVRGKSKDLAKVSTRAGESQIIADLSEVEAGVSRVNLKAIGFPNGVQIVQMNPSYVTVTVEKITKKEVPIEVRIKGQPAEGYKVGEPIVNPSRVLLSAPASQLEPIHSVLAEVDVSGASKAVVGEYKLLALDEAGAELNVAITPAAANVEVPITVPYKTVALQVRLRGAPPPGYSVSSYQQSDNQVTIYGPEDVLQKIDIYDAIEINLAELTEDLKQTFEIPLKEGLESVHPSSVDIHIEIAQSVTKTIQGVPIRLNGLDDNLEADLGDEVEGFVAVTVEGAPSQIATLQPEQIEVVVDVSNLPPGEHVREMKVNLPVFVKLRSIQPGRITVIIHEPSGEVVAPPAVDPPPVEPPPEEKDPPVTEGGPIGRPPETEDDDKQEPEPEKPTSEP